MRGGYIFKNILGSFVFDRNLNLVQTVDKKQVDENLKEPSPEEIKKILDYFKKERFFPED